MKTNKPKKAVPINIVIEIVQKRVDDANRWAKDAREAGRHQLHMARQYQNEADGLGQYLATIKKMAPKAKKPTKVKPLKVWS